jgi:hypothetical protein
MMTRCLQRFLAILLVLLVGGTPASAARLFTSGFELQSLTNGVEWHTSDTPPTACSINTTAGTVRSGASSMRCNSAGGAAKGQVVRLFASGANGTNYFLRAYIRFAAWPNAATTLMGWGDTAVAQRVRVMLDTDQFLYLEMDTGASLDQKFDATPTTLSLNTWYRIELEFNRDAAAPNTGLDDAIIRLDGVTEVDGTDSFSLSALPTRALFGLNMNGDADTTGDIYFDDIAVNDSTDDDPVGSAQTSWPGAGNVDLLVPNAAGEFNQTVTAVGGPGTYWETADDGILTGGVDDVDYTTFTDAAANWTGAGSRLALAMSCMPASPSSVSLVAFGVRVKTETASNAQYSLSVQTANGGTKATDFNPAAWQTTAWVTNYPTNIRSASPFTLYTDPDAAAWTETTINSLQFLMRSGDATPDIHLTSAWAMVEHVGGSGACGGGGGGSSRPPTILMIGVSGNEGKQQ